MRANRSATPSPLAEATQLDLAMGDQRAAQVWVLRLADLDPGELDPTPLDEQERNRLSRLQRPADRGAFLAAHLLLRQLLGSELEVKKAERAAAEEKKTAKKKDDKKDEE